MNRFLSFVKTLSPGIAWAVFILILCAIPGKDLPNVWWMEILSIDKLVHAGLFAIFIVLVLKGLIAQKSFLILNQKAVIIAFIFCVSYGFLMEIMQHFCFIDRTFDLWDAAANSVGCIAGHWWWKRNLSTI